MSSKHSKASMLSPSKFFGQDDSAYVWVTEFDDESLEQFYAKFTELEEDPGVSVIPVIISSYGGDVPNLLAMRDLIKSSVKPVATIAIGKAMSAGAALLAAGTKGLRFAGPSTLIMIHEISSGADGRPADIIQKAVSVKQLNEQMFENLAGDTGQSVKTLKKAISGLEHADWYLSADEAVELGLIDHAEIPRLVAGAAMSDLMMSKPPVVAQKKGKGR